jgi:hypothetical protein
MLGALEAIPSQTRPHLLTQSHPVRLLRRSGAFPPTLRSQQESSCLFLSHRSIPFGKGASVDEDHAVFV